MDALMKTVQDARNFILLNSRGLCMAVFYAQQDILYLMNLVFML